MPIAVLSAQEMKSVENWTRSNQGISEYEMISMAGDKIFDFTNDIFQQLNIPKDKKWAFLCGKGHNGADGIRTAILASQSGYRTEVFQIFSDKGYSRETRELQDNYSKLGSIIFIHKMEDLIIPDDTGIIIDGLLGAGITRKAEGILGECIKKVNGSNLPVISIDIPSGLFTDSPAEAPHISPDMTIMLGSPKLSYLFQPTRTEFGKGVFHPLCFPAEKTQNQPSAAEVFSKKDAVSVLPKRNYNTHKYSAGKVLIIAGSKGMHGAAVLAAKSCACSGAGMVKLAVPAGIHPEICYHTIETISIPVGIDRLQKISGGGWFEPEDCEQLLPLAEWADTVLLGPGIGKQPETASFLNQIIPQISNTLILDGDGIQFFYGSTDKKSEQYTNITCTPHGGEYKQMGGNYCYEHPLDHISSLRDLTAKLGINILLKGPTSFFCSRGNKCVILPPGNAGLASAGTGDVLSGIIASLSCKVNISSAVSLSVYIHSQASHKAAETTGILPMIASDIINSIPAVIKKLETEKNREHLIEENF